MKKITCLVLSLGLVLLAGCVQGTATATPDPTQTPTASPAATATPTPAPTPAPTPDPTPEATPTPEPTPAPTEEVPETPEAGTELRYAEIEIENYGTVKLELDPAAAPITVENFVKLVEDGFYDGLTFHRIIDGFMIQGGDPLGNGYGGAEETIKGEFALNGVDNPISHVRGVISMARSQMPDSASSQFFIVQSDSLFLDGQYAAFGRVTEGMDYVDQICKDTQVEDNNGTVLAENQPVITAIRMVEG